MTGKRSGWFFAARIVERVYLRFIPREAGHALVTEIGTCLRLIECEENAPRLVESWMSDGVYEAWIRAQDSILAAWSFETDPAHLQPKIPRLNREVAEYLRRHPPPDITQEDFDRCIEAIESPWSRREENLLREEWSKDFAADALRAKALLLKVKEIGVEPFRAPEPLPPAGKEDIHLICWLGLQAP